MRLQFALGMLCSVAVFSIYNAFPEHSKQENWEKRCLCVSWLCGCAQDVKQDVDGRYICSRLCSCVTDPVLLILMPHNRNSSWRVTAKRCMAACIGIVPVTQGQHRHTALLGTAHHNAPFAFQYDPNPRPIRLATTVLDGMPAVL